jgi:hypothetical protein
LDLTLDSWNKVYEHLFGGFEDIGDDSEENVELDTDEELEELSKTGVKVKQTKQGYVKDGFIVDDDEEDEDYEPVSKSKKRVVKSKTIRVEIRKTKSTKNAKEPTPPPVEPENTYLDCTSELGEESYV